MSLPEIEGGRFVPAIVIDQVNNKAIGRAIEAHKVGGDVDMQWCGFPLSGDLGLFLQFRQPAEVEFTIKFILRDEFFIIDAIMQARGFYLQVGKEGDKVSSFGGDMLLIEVPKSLNFDSQWNEILKKVLRSKLKKSGIPKSRLDLAVQDCIQEMRKIYKIHREV